MSNWKYFDTDLVSIIFGGSLVSNGIDYSVIGGRPSLASTSSRNYNIAQWRQLVFINILGFASKVVFRAIIFKNLLFFTARVNRNLSYKWFVIVIFVDFESFNFMKYIIINSL